MWIVGIDCGKNGALCLLRDGVPFLFEDMPLTKDGDLDEGELLTRLRNLIDEVPLDEAPRFLIERIAGDPRWSCDRNWSMASTYYAVRMAIRALGFSYEMVEASHWRACAGIPPIKDYDERKLASVNQFRNLWPTLYDDGVLLKSKRCKKPSSDRAEAALIAYSGWIDEQRKGGEPHV